VGRTLHGGGRHAHDVGPNLEETVAYASPSCYAAGGFPPTHSECERRATTAARSAPTLRTGCFPGEPDLPPAWAGTVSDDLAMSHGRPMWPSHSPLPAARNWPVTRSSPTASNLRVHGPHTITLARNRQIVIHETPGAPPQVHPLRGVGCEPRLRRSRHSWKTAPIATRSQRGYTARRSGGADEVRQTRWKTRAAARLAAEV